MAEEAPAAAQRLARAGSFSGVWWKLGDAAADPSVADRRLRSIADEEADLRARIARRQAGARGARRNIAWGSLALEAVAFIHAYWTARRRRRVAGGWSRKLLLLVLPPLLAIPASAALFFAAFARFQKMFDARDQQGLQTLVAERKAKIGQFRGSHHNMQKLLEKYDPDAAEADTGSDQPFTAAVSRIKRSHSRLSIYKKPDPDAAVAEAASTGSDQPAAAGLTRIRRSNSRLSFHIGDE